MPPKSQKPKEKEPQQPIQTSVKTTSQITGFIYYNW